MSKMNAAPEGVPVSELIDNAIAELGDWRGEILARLRKLIHEADPDVVEEWKWGKPVWSHAGILCTGETYKAYVKTTFAKGASVPDPTGLFNASLDGDTLVLKNYWHIGFAADTPNGLMVPVIRDVDQKTVPEIAKEMGDLAKLARDGKLKPDQMSGGTFTISSLGGIGGIYFTPIINAPEVAILGVCKSQTEPVWDGKQFVPRLMLPLSLSWDHRVIDGAAAARFNVHFANVLADLRRVLF